jgi:nitrite reductase (NO-forming)
MVLLACMVASLTISDLNNFQLFVVAASHAVTITPDNREEDELENEGGNEAESSQTQKDQNGEAIQPAEDTDTSDTNDQDREGEYQIDIPDGAAWEETISERFYPPELTVPTGSDVTWTNDDDIAHTITSGKNAGYGLYEFLQDGIFNSGELDKEESFTFHFAEPGRYEYFCIPHPWMNGVIVVQ